jgi:hypothetical protein
MKKALKALALIIILAIAVVAVSYVINFKALTTTLPSISSSKPTPTPATTPITNNVTLSGSIISHGLTIPPTEVQFINTETHEVYKAPINQLNYSYSISLPSNQTYGIEGDWNGRTFNATGIPMGAITMRLDNGSPILNLYNVNSTITQILEVGQ